MSSMPLIDTAKKDLLTISEGKRELIWEGVSSRIKAPAFSGLKDYLILKEKLIFRKEYFCKGRNKDKS